MGPRVMLLVVGAGRSGTSSFSGVMNRLGFHVPPPMVGAHESNPLGHFEPLWAVRFHSRILAESGFDIVDGDPMAGHRILETARGGSYRDELRAWLAALPESEERIVIKDPRTVWVAPLWAEVAAELGMVVIYVTMLRDPAGVVGSHSHHYSKAETEYQQLRADTAILAGWININLVAEAATRRGERQSILYEDFLQDWRQAITSLRSRRGFPANLSIDGEVAARVDDFLDPGLHRVRRTLEESQIPASLKGIAEALWVDLADRARGSVDEGIYVQRIQKHREAFRDLYNGSEMISRDRVRRYRRGARAVGYQDALKDAAQAVDNLRHAGGKT